MKKVFSNSSKAVPRELNEENIANFKIVAYFVIIAVSNKKISIGFFSKPSNLTGTVWM
jgi:hypothetical protein